jgi:hypothetical protein
MATDYIIDNFKVAITKRLRANDFIAINRRFYREIHETMGIPPGRSRMAINEMAQDGLLKIESRDLYPMVIVQVQK